MIRRLALVPIVFCIGSPRQLSGQVSLHLGAGVRQGSTMVHDFIVEPIDVRPRLAPAFVVTAGTALEGRWTVEISLDYSSAILDREEDGASYEVATARAFSARLDLRRRLAPSLSGSLGIGAIKYLSDEEVGIFHEGAGPISALGSIGLRYHVAFIPSGRFAVAARYDIHRFTTPALKDAGFTTGSPVHRLTLLVVARLVGQGP